MENPINFENFSNLSTATHDFANWGIEVIAYLNPKHEVGGYTTYLSDGHHLAFSVDS
jgi:hypothetical protein